VTKARIRRDPGAERVFASEGGLGLALSGVALEMNPRDRVTALSHLYRGELHRMTTYRVRLDTTTNWAVGTTAAMISFALGNASLPHWIFGLTVALDLMFLRLEAQRYQLYRRLQRRVRIIEIGFFPEVLDGTGRLDWQRSLLAGLESPEAPISKLQAVSVRLRRVYLWLIGAAYVGWFVKLIQLGHVPESATMSNVPGLIVIALGLVPLALALALTFYHGEPEEE
jgi:uncharacterized membrane protein